jgi:hypothetical protein
MGRGERSCSPFSVASVLRSCLPAEYVLTVASLWHSVAKPSIAEGAENAEDLKARE